ncbi:hypothetical protein JRQ81_018254 [Phrynocephalus forsythii]|uniref:Triacylglycerol lipase n=1 Tax=Phrynocephalus forsythii TaxID=171643 RepID=A0A9Q0XSF8_9SAUR|nr:hypothetical protein JRQ81_018254 [Phrynocephalus forsythii]
MLLITYNLSKGLDPAGIGFEGFPDMVRLDPSDAEFVDVIHSNAGQFPNIGLGMLNATGDLDFYPNGGSIMVGCYDAEIPLPDYDHEGSLKDVRSVANCHHSRSHQYYRYSILYPLGFLGYPCESYESFQEGNCFPCPIEGCPMMGHYADRFPGRLQKKNTKYYLNTGPTEPFTMWRYNISVKLSGMSSVKGEINLAFHSKGEDIKEYQIGSGDLKREQTYAKITDLEINPANAISIEFIWHKKFLTLLWAKLGAERVSLIRGQDGHEIVLKDISVYKKVPCSLLSVIIRDEERPRRSEVCYDRLGCFTNDAPWSGTILRPISKLPWSPEKIKTRFLLYTRKNINNFEEIKATSPETISQSNFDPSKITRFITHGFVDKGEENWLSDMCKNMFQVEDVNCICIDWKGGSQCPYTQAANNIRVIGAEVAYFIDVLMAKYGYSPSMVHIIGHSLGAHMAGEAGKRRPGIGRITGLDPAQPYFQGTPVEVRLDKSDALFVDVIHTDMLPTIPYMGFGMSDPVGHLDFFPNGGETMPGCSKNPVSQIVDIDGIWEGMSHKNLL